jgi:hypothetical protein
MWRAERLAPLGKARVARERGCVRIRGISQEQLPLSLAFCEVVHNVRKRGTALLHALMELLVTEDLASNRSPKPIRTDAGPFHYDPSPWLWAVHPKVGGSAHTK